MRSIGSLLITVVLLVGLLPFLNLRIAIADQQPGTAERWIDVDLSARIATAFIGSTPVYSAPVTSGKPGWETPTGVYYILYRVDHETMDSVTIGVPRGSAEGYYLTNVRYAQYFKWDGTGLHGNYWQPEGVFGNADTSHGCVGLREADAGYFWNFAKVGTRIVLHRTGQQRIKTFIGLSVAEARLELQELGMLVEESRQWHDQVPSGRIFEQTPGTGTVAQRGSLVKLTVSNGPPPVIPGDVGFRQPEGEWAWVPNVIGLPENEARKRIEFAGLTNSYSNYQLETDVPAVMLPFYRSILTGHVLSTVPQSGEKVPKGNAVMIAVHR